MINKNIPSNSAITPKLNVIKNASDIKIIVFIKCDPRSDNCLNDSKAFVGCSFIRLIKSPIYYASLYDLFKAYSLHKARVAFAKMTIKSPALYSMEDALKRLEKILGLGIPGWERLEKFLPDEFSKGVGIRSGISSTLAASLELARERKIDINQEEIFGPIYITKVAEEV